MNLTTYTNAALVALVFGVLLFMYSRQRILKYVGVILIFGCAYGLFMEGMQRRLDL